jgi:hypothetical protein
LYRINKNDYLLHSAKALVGGAFYKKLPQTPAKTLMVAYQLAQGLSQEIPSL